MIVKQHHIYGNLSLIGLFFNTLHFPYTNLYDHLLVNPIFRQGNLNSVQHLYIYKMYVYMYAAAKSLESCPTLCDPRDDSPPGSPVPGILQARTVEWVAISFSNA